MKGLTVRWSLADAPDGVEEELASYVAGHLARPLHRHGRAALQDLADAPGEWFEGCYVFATDEARARFQATFTAERRRVAGLADRSAARRS